MTLPHETFTHLLSQTAHAWRLAVDRQLKHSGLGMSSWMAIARLSTQTAPVSQKELALALGLEEATIVPLVDKLIKQQLVERTQTAEDRRKRLVHITPEGQALYQRLSIELDKLRSELLATSSRDELFVAQRVLQKLLKAIEAK
ncbi:MarR family winged helix-turn-helix transcriptional regulator [Kalamiella sp. sgz302252]|uniref:MarR family winged helix-turn-helix transcriptional regulator n=1 Tax=Pantoea sp. sgz302252 TaxID=3341827 RepID=UPI0036D2FA42